MIRGDCILKYFWESRFLPLTFFLIGLLFSCWISWKSFFSIQETEQIRFQSATNHIESLIYKEINAHIQLIHGVAAFMNASNYVSREEWTRYALENHIHEHFLGFRAIGYAPLVKTSDRLEHEKSLHEEGYPHYKIFQLNPTFDEPMFPITYIEPLSELNEKAFGFDLASETTRKDALYHAINRADATLSSKITLTQTAS